jgi:hypothetical protein
LPTLAALAYAAVFVVEGTRLLARFPRSYTWSELLISYQGGFMRRGLLGEAGYLLHPVVGADLAISFLVVAAYLCVAAAVVVGASRRWSLPVLLCLVSPGLLLFPVWDFEAFGRKDVFILAAFVVTLWVARSVRDLSRAALSIAAVYTVVALAHEIAWFYFVTAIASLLLMRRDALGSARARVLAAALAYAAGWVCLMLVYPGSKAQVAAMIDAWQVRVPAAYRKPGAESFLGFPFRASILMVLGHQQHLITTAGYVAAFCLTGLPVGFVLRERWAALELDRGRSLVLAVGVVALLVPFAMGADWGRCAYLFWMHALLFGLFAASPPRDGAPTLRPGFAVAALVVVVYATSWRMLHFAEGGESPLVPGYVISGAIPPR